jgi:hypothetical protein
MATSTVTRTFEFDPKTLPNPRKYPLRALCVILQTYLPLGGSARLRLPANFRPLAQIGAYLHYFLSEGYVSTLLCMLIPAFLLMIDRQLARKKAAYGGWLHPNHFTLADLIQYPADREALRQMTCEALFRQIGEELRLLIRVLREAQMFYRALWQDHEQPWLRYHKAGVVVLLRLAQMSAELRARGSRCYAEECLRWQARVVWAEQFQRARAPEAVQKWLKPLGEEEITAYGKWRMVTHLCEEQAAGRPVLAPFVGRFPRWREEVGM